MILSIEAEADLDEIFAYSIEQWDLDRAGAYRERLDRMLAALLDNPGRGPPFDPDLPGVRSLKAGEHRIFYTVANDAVRVARILHHAMDAPRRLFGV